MCIKSVWPSTLYTTRHESSITPSPSIMAPQPLWLRCEKKEFERRTAITPTTAKKLIDAGFEIFVERDNQRIFRDEEYEA